jgi:hypothetical protein
MMNINNHMDKKTRKSSKSSSYSEIASLMSSYRPVNRNGWWIKFSVMDGDNILLVFTSMFTGQTVVRHYTNEDDAVAYINFITECDPDEEINP